MVSSLQWEDVLLLARRRGFELAVIGIKFPVNQPEPTFYNLSRYEPILPLSR